MNNRLRNKWIKRFFPLIALLLLAPWPVVYAHTYTDDMAGQDTVRIEAAEASATPSMAVFGKAIGRVTPGDLFYIDASDNQTHNQADIQVNLYLTNTQDLINYYKYLILKVGVYVENDAGEWEKASMGNGELIDDIFITMRNGRVSFTLPGLAKYKVTIDSGNFYCFSVSGDKSSFSPQFYLEVDQPEGSE